MKKIVIVFGTRPEAIKMAPVTKAAQANGHFNVKVCVTAQHRQMLDQVLGLFDICPDYDLNIMRKGQDLFDVTCNVLRGVKKVLQAERPDIVLVQGDTTTAMTTSLAAFYQQLPVGHVEAGLRTHNKLAPFPEEINRKLTGVIADLHFAPTEIARDNLLREGVDPTRVHVTGNTVIDALLIAANKIRSRALSEKIVSDLICRFPSLKDILQAPQNSNRRMILVTGHRRENFGKGFENICSALLQLATEQPHVDFIYPVHLNPNVRGPVLRLLKHCPSIHLIEPLDYLPFVYLMTRSTFIITDSGGIQEEAPSLGKPVLVMRETTERPEAVTAGTAKLVGTDPKQIVGEASRLLNNRDAFEKMAKTANPYGDGRAAERVIAILQSFLQNDPRRTPASVDHRTTT